jgi:3'-phosphoadenosine 5'-phosphosulfate sulfotransferase (PAPS reductase)/FAD synthetase
MNNLPKEVQDAQVIFISHSGGKDSQAMLARIVRLNLAAKIVVVHSDLGEMEWEPMHHFIEQNAFGLPVHVVRAQETFFDLCRRTKRFPSGRQQYCTDFLKIIPIAAFIHDYMTKNNITVAINATGMRAEESERRAKKEPFALSGMTQPRKYPGHTIYDWLPIFDYKVDDVWQEIKNAGQTPHPIYFKGFSRLSCVFCINGRKNEHQKAAEMRPELYAKMVELEKELGKSLRQSTVDGEKVHKYLGSYCGSEAPAHEFKLRKKTKADLEIFNASLKRHFPA